MDSLNWRKSARSSGNGENCVELANAPGIVAVRDSKDPDGPKLTFSRAAFAAFAAEVKSN
jgi:hypothetical protein